MLPDKAAPIMTASMSENMLYFQSVTSSKKTGHTTVDE